MDDTSSDSAGTAPGTVASASTAPGVDSGGERSSRRVVVRLIVVLGALIAVFGVGLFLVTDGLAPNAPGVELEGHWSGTRTVATCEGGLCPPGQDMFLAVDCSRSRCTVSVFDEPAELEEAGDGFTASGSIPIWHLDPCTGGGFVNGRWWLDLRLDGEALVGSYTEETTSSCGPVLSRTVSITEASWNFELTREEG